MNNICCSFRIFEDIPTWSNPFIPKNVMNQATFHRIRATFLEALPWSPILSAGTWHNWRRKGRYKLVIACVGDSTYWWVLESCLLDIFGSFSILRIFLPFWGEVAFVSLSVAANAVLGLNFGQQGINFTMPLLCIKIFDLFAAHSVDLEISKSQIWRPKRGEISPKRLRTQLIAR